MRRYLLAFFALYLMIACAMAETYVVNFADGAAAVDYEGNEQIPSGKYLRLIALHGDDGALSGYAAGINTDSGIRYGVLTPDGEALTDFIYASVAPAGDKFICGDGRLYSILSADGSPTFEKYSAVSYAGDGVFFVLTGNVNDEIADALSRISSDGTVAPLEIGVVYGLGAFAEELMPLCDGSNTKFGYLDREGSWAIAPIYEFADDFISGYAVVSTHEGYGLIDRAGNAIIEITYDFIERGDGCLIARKEDMLTVFDISASGVTETVSMPLEGAYPRVTGKSVVLTSRDAVCVLNAHGDERFTLPPSASVIEAGGRFLIRDGDWAARSAYLADASGAAVSDFYNTIRLLDGAGDAAVYAYGIMDEDTREMKFGLMRADGETVTGAQYDALVSVRPGLYFAEVNGQRILIDAEGASVTAFAGAPDAS